MPTPVLRFVLICACGMWVVLLAIGCTYRAGREPKRTFATDDVTPSWYNNPPMGGAQVYAVGAVAGHNREAAVAEAHKDLARQLHITIDDHGDEIDDSQVAPADQRPATLHVKSLDLPGVTVARMQQTSDATYVLLAFDREGWATSLRARIAAVDERIRDIESFPAAANNGLSAAAIHYQSLRPLVLERDDLYARLLIAEPATSVPPGRVTLNRIHHTLAAECAGHLVDLSVGASLDPVEKELVGALARFGFRVKPGASGAALRIELSVTLDERTIDGMNRAQGTFTAATRRGADNQMLGSITIEVRTGSPSATIAHDRLLQKLAERWQDYLDDGFVDCLTRF